MSPLNHEATLEFEHAAHRFEHEGIGLSLVCFEHADEVARAGDLGAQAAAEPPAVGAVAQVLVTAPPQPPRATLEPPRDEGRFADGDP